ncbi:hypothetical protein FACS1894184_12450 [Clostridia bacterium]|nr:hypothetical protein FACS1894184_12450 [Clostridia bacterium]
MSIPDISSYARQGRFYYEGLFNKQIASLVGATTWVAPTVNWVQITMRLPRADAAAAAFPAGSLEVG